MHDAMPAAASGVPAAEPRRLAKRFGAQLAWLTACVAGGALLSVPFTSYRLGPVALVALVPWLLVAGRRRASPSRVTFFVGAGLFTFFALSLGWLPAHFGWKVCLTVWAYFTLLALPTPWLWVVLQRRFAAPLVVVAPLAWVAVEYLRSRVPLGHLGLYMLGHTLSDYLSAIQSAELWGVPGVSFLIVLANAAVADLLLAGLEAARAGRPLRGGCVRRAGLILLGVVVILAINCLFGAWRLHATELSPGPRLALVQPAAMHLPLATQNRYNLRRQADITREAVSPGSCDLVVWPEGTVLGFYEGVPEYEKEVWETVHHVGADLVLGAHSPDPEDPERAFTSMFHITPDGFVAGRHDKLVLIPGTEYIPFQRVLDAIAPALSVRWSDLVAELVRARPNGVTGERVTVFELASMDPPLRFGAMACYEATDSTVARRFAAEGAVFLVNPTSEGRIGKAASEHALRITAFRAIENRLPVARAGNVGITAFIDPLGRVHAVLVDRHGVRLGNLGVLQDRVRFASTGRTLYTVGGDWFAQACLAACLTGLLMVVMARRRSQRASEGEE